MPRIPLALLVLAAVTPAPAVASVAPAGFGRASAHVANRWFPLVPGTTFVYRGTKDGTRSRDVVVVTTHVRRIEGVRCRAVRDRLFLAGRLAERTLDWYAQDRRGRVWYFGERTAELDARGRVTSTEGSWLAGRDDARPGIFMPAHPRVGQQFRQEDFPGHAEDRFRVVSVDAHVRLPFGAFDHALVTREWTPLEPGVVDRKRYVRGIGLVSEASVKGGREFAHLVRVTSRTS